MTMLRVRAMVTMPDVAFGEEKVVGDGPSIRALIEKERYMLLEEIADEPEAAAAAATAGKPDDGGSASAAAAPAKVASKAAKRPDASEGDTD